jgi:NADPH:quinone reductase-like Zn-dependent oxidoreductase
VLVQVAAAGVNPIDWKFRAGWLREMVPIDFPTTPGIDLAGTVEAVGSGVAGLVAGAEVFGRGGATYAQFALAPADGVALKPAGLSFEQAATLGVGGVTAWTGLFDGAGLEPGTRLLVQGGAGGVGSLAVQLAKWKGAYVAATTSTANVDFVRSLGADEVIDYTATRFEDVVDDIDVVYDTVGGEVTDRSWQVLRTGGTLIVIGAMPDTEKAASLGVQVTGAPPPDRSAPILQQLAELAENGAIQVHAGQTFRLADAAAAQAASETGHGRGRIVLVT